MIPLAARNVLVVGAGGLGTPCLIGLLARGIRRVTILDPDRVEITNLHRQILYRETDLGRPKVLAMAEALAHWFPDAEIVPRQVSFDAAMASELAAFDVVVEGTDRFETKLAISDACVDARVPYVFGGVVAFEGQVLGVRPMLSACLRCLFDEAPPPGAAPTCEEVGILGPIAGIAAARQAEIAVGLLLERPEAVNSLWVYDGRRDRARIVPLRRSEDCRGCGSRRAFRGAAPSLLVPPERVEADVLDLSGMVCPQTYVETRRALESLRAGRCLWVLLTSDESFRGVAASAEASGHKALARISDGRVHRLLLQAGTPARLE